MGEGGGVGIPAGEVTPISLREGVVLGDGSDFGHGGATLVVCVLFSVCYCS